MRKVKKYNRKPKEITFVNLEEDNERFDLKNFSESWNSKLGRNSTKILELHPSQNNHLNPKSVLNCKSKLQQIQKNVLDDIKKSGNSLHIKAFEDITRLNNLIESLEILDYKTLDAAIQNGYYVDLDEGFLLDDENDFKAIKRGGKIAIKQKKKNKGEDMILEEGDIALDLEEDFDEQDDLQVEIGKMLDVEEESDRVKRNEKAKIRRKKKLGYKV